MAQGSRNLRKSTRAQVIQEITERLNALEAITGQIYHAASNDILRLERVLRELCEKAEIEFEEAVFDEPNVETTQGESDE